MLERKGIQAYFSSCLTLSLGKSYSHNADEDIYLVDILPQYPTVKSVFKSFNSFHKSIKTKDIFRLGKREKIIQKILGEDIIQRAKEITHVYRADEFPTEESRFELADRTLKCYEKAKLVITSRIHCALPCLAMGTPVIFINGGFNLSQSSRFEGIADLFHTVNVSRGADISADFDLEEVRISETVKPKNDHLKYVENLVTRCENFVDNINGAAGS
jgi:hypothetical protein